MAKKQAYQTYYRDKNGELRIQLVDAETGKPVTDPKKYDVIDTTEAQGQELTGVLDTQEKVIPKSKSTIKNSKVRRFSEGSDRGTKGKGRKGDETNKFGFIDKPNWTKYASLIPGPVGKVAALGNTAVNAVNVNAINEARKHLGLEPTTMKDVVKGIVAGVDEGSVGNVGIGKKSYGVSLNEPVIEGKTQLTPQEARVRKDLRTAQDEVAKHLTEKGFPNPNINRELDYNKPTEGVKKGKGLADVVKSAIGLPAGLDMVDGYRARLSSINFDEMPGLDPATVQKAKEFQKAAIDKNLDLAVDVKDMVRTPERQAAIAATGASKTKVSEHMAALALDVSPVDVNDQAGWSAKRDLANSLGWGQLDPSWDPAHMGLTKSNKTPGALNMTKEQAVAARNYFGSVPMSTENKAALGFDTSVPTPTARPAEMTSYSAPTKAMTPKEQFYSEQYGYAKKAGLTGLAADIAVSQAAVESGYGTGQLASKNNNLHSIKAGQTWTGPTASYKDDEIGPSSFRSYENPVESYKDWGAVMEKNFPGVLTAKNLPEAITALDNGVLGKYATAKDYGTKLTKAYNEFQATGINTARPETARPSSFQAYSKDFYSKVQEAIDISPDTSGIQGTEASLGNAKNDAESSGRMGFGKTGDANRPASGMSSMGGIGNSNMGRSDSPSSGRSSFGGNPGISGNSPSEGGSRFGGGGLGSPSTGNRPTHTTEHERDTSLGGLSSFGGNLGGKKDKDKDSNRPGTGGFGNYSGGGEKV